MKIILDTNAIFDDDLMEKTSMSILDNFAKQTQAEICIPFVVVEEKIRQFGERCVSVVSAYRQANNLKTLLGHKTIQIENANLLVSEYRKLLLKRLADLEIKILPLPNTPIANLLNRDLKRRSPFDSSGKGFRDALIWETISSRDARKR